MNKVKNTDLEIKKATEGDIEEILVLQKLAYKSEAMIYDDFSIPPLHQTIDEIQNEFQRRVFLKIEKEGRIIGSVRGHEEQGTCYIGKLIVHPEEQNQGLGTRLMIAIEKKFGKAERYELFTGHRSERNLYLYRKLGYKEFKKEEMSLKLTLIYLEKKAQS